MQFKSTKRYYAGGAFILFSTFLVILSRKTTLAQVPDRPPTWVLNQSTIIMPCNNSGYTDPKTTVGWSVIDFDWSNAKALWVADRPMDDEVYLQRQVEMSTSASLGQTVWVYRGSMWAYPWYTSIRKTLEDPTYSDWFLKFKPEGPYYSKKCDDNWDPPICSDLYHNNEQTPGYPHGDGDCPAPNCDCGKGVPCGFYMWNHSSTTVVNNQTFFEWFRDDYIFDAQGTSPLVSGMYFDDFWPDSGSRFPDSYPNMTEDMGLTQDQISSIAKSYERNMAEIYDGILKRGMFSWQQLWNGQSNPSQKNGCCTKPLVEEGKTCATSLRAMCSADSPAQTRTMMYAFSPGHCGGDPSKLVQPLHDIANFLLVRGKYAYLGHGWLGCSHEYEVPEQINWDYGEPTELCKETAKDSGVFSREWTKATIQMDCNSWTPTITMK
jgi:hypothetical protein